MLNCCCCLNTVAVFRANPCPPHPFFWVCKWSHSLWELPVFSALFRNLISNAGLVWTQSIAVSLHRGWALLCSWQFTGMEACPLFVFQVPGAAGLNRERFCFVRTYRTVSAYKLLWEEVEGLGLFSSPRPLDVDHILPLSTLRWMFAVRVFSIPQCQDL